MIRRLALATLAVALTAPAVAAPKHPRPPVTTKAGPKAKKPAPAPSDDAAPTPEDELVHIVKPGETLGGIAQRAKVPRVLIAEANGLAEPYSVRTGQKLKIPRTRHHTVAEGETGFDIAYKYGVPFGAIAVANGLASKAVIKPGQDLLIPTILATPSPPSSTAPSASPTDEPKPKASTPDFAWPLTGKVRRGFTGRDQRNYHDGIDIAAEPGAAVRAAAGGTVIFAGQEPKSFGNLVVVQHGEDWQSAYGFLGKITVAKGEAVRRKERIGLVGRTGKATRDELHFEIRQANRPVDPVDQLPKQP
jgi:murein DD-endopeptidase MepM/ murein hydrolase activator NlpD